MSLTFEFTVPGDPNELSFNRRLHHLEKARRVKEWRTMAWMLSHSGIFPRFTRKVRITFTFCRARALDPDNCFSAATKAIVDALQPDIIADDGPRFVEYAPVVQLISLAYKGREKVIVEIEELPGDPI